MVRTSKLLIAFISALTLGSAAGPANIWLDVPFVKQPREGCGAAAIAMVIQYWMAHGAPRASAPVDVEAIQQALHSDRARGAFAADVARYFQQAGFRTFAFRGSWADLQQHLAEGRPVIVGIGPDGRSRALHYLVVTGLDQNIVLVNDPARRKLLKLRRSDFETAWKATDNWTLLALPQEVH